MILVDTNLLVYAHVEDFEEHEAARTWLDERLGGTAKVGLPWESLTAYVRLVTNPRVFPRPLAAPDAMAQVREWLSRPAAWCPAPTERHADILAELLSVDGVRADLVPDAHLAAIAVGHGLTVMSNDTDFARFPTVRWENPLAGTHR
ncbi:MAG TPA: type II toxin-antitoxin system VapC family toxin [Acidimicrobiales bacterium]